MVADHLVCGLETVAERLFFPHLQGFEGMKWTNVIFLYLYLKTAIKKNNPRKYLRSVGDGETVEFDVVEGEKVRLLW